MDASNEELTSLVQPVVAVIDQIEHHATIDKVLSSLLTPTLRTISLGSPADLVSLQRDSAAHSDSLSGVLDRQWLIRQQNQRPAVAALIVQAKDVVGDPISWTNLVSKLEAVKSATKQTNMRTVVIVVHDASILQDGTLPEDRAAMLCRHSNIDRKSIVVFSKDRPADVQLLAATVQEQAVAFYTGETQRLLALHSQANDPTVEANLRTAFKLGVIAEFRADYDAAHAMLSEAYNYIQQLHIAGPSHYQRFIEVRAVAEFIHVKLMALNLFGLQQPGEAITQLNAHLKLFKRVPFKEAPYYILGDHWRWISQQYRTAAEILVSSGTGWAELPQSNHPSQLLLAAAEALVERRKGAELASRASSQSLASPGGGVESLQVQAGQYVGQYIATVPQLKKLTEHELLSYLEAQELSASHSIEAANLLQMARTSLQQSSLYATRSLFHASFLLGQELLTSNNPVAAKPVLEETAAAYRKEAWTGPLFQTLVLLRECAVQLQDMKLHVACSLEAAAVKEGVSEAERQAMASAALTVLTTGSTPASSQLDPNPTLLGGQMNGTIHLKDGVAGQAGGSTSGGLNSSMDFGFECEGSNEEGSADLRINQQHQLQEQWVLKVVACQSGFLQQQQQMPAYTTSFGVGLCNQLPVAVPFTSVEARFKDGQGTFSVLLHRCDANGGLVPPAPASDAKPMLEPGQWVTFSGSVQFRCSGKLMAESVKLRISSNASLTLPLIGTTAAAASMHQSSQFPAVVFKKQTGFVPGMTTISVPPKHVPPTINLSTFRTGLLGEPLPVQCCIIAGKDAIKGLALKVSAIHLDTRKPIEIQGVTVSNDASEIKPLEEVLAVGNLPAESEHLVNLKLLPTARGEALIRVTGTYTAQTESSSAGVDEPGSLDVSMSIAVEVPFQLGLNFLTPPQTRFILASDSDASSLAPPASAAAATNENLPTDLIENALDGLTISKAANTKTAGHAPMVSESELDSILMSWPNLVTLPTRLTCTALLAIIANSSCPIDILGIDWHLPNESTLTLQPFSSNPLPTTPTVVCERHQAAFNIQSEVAQQVASLGKLTVHWRRHQSPSATPAPSGPFIQHTSSSSSVQFTALNSSPSIPYAGSGVATVSSVIQSIASGSVALEAGPSSPRKAPAASAQRTVLMHAQAQSGALTFCLPSALFKPAKLLGRVEYGATGVYREPFEVTVEVRNGGKGVENVNVVVGQPHGFMIAGERNSVLPVLPGTSAIVTWEMVPYHAGVMQLPEIKILGEGGEVLEVTSNCVALIQHAPGAC